WSKTRISALRECRRKFLFSAPLDASLSADIQNEAARLKKLRNRYLWGGSVLHDSIGLVLKKLRQGSALPSADELIHETRERMREEFKSSRAGLKAASRLFEHEYQVTLNPEKWQEHWQDLERSLRWFMASSWLARLQTLGPECWKAVDEV